MFSAGFLLMAYALSAPADSGPVAAPPQPIPAATTDSQPAPKSTAQELDDFLQLITGNNTPEAREIGARNLLRNGSDEAARRLIDVLRAPNDALAKQAVCRAMIAVEKPHPSLLDPLLALLGRNPPEVSQMIPPALRRFEAGAVIPRLCSKAADGQSPIEQRHAAIVALGLLGDDLKAVEALMEILKDPTESLRIAALDALSDIAGTRFVNAAATKGWWESHRNMDPVVWLRTVNQRRKDEIQRMREDREVILARLVASYRESYLLTPEIEQPKKLLAFLRDESSAVRGLALDLINGLITDRKEIGQEVRQQVLRLVSDSNPVIRRRAAGIVGDLRPAGSGERLSAALVAELDPAVRAAQVAAIGRLDDVSAIPMMIESLDDTSRAVVIEAAAAIGALSRRGNGENGTADRVVEALLTRYQSIPAEDDELREKFVEAMGRIGADGFQELLIKEIESSHGVRTRSAAIAALSLYPSSAEPIRKGITAQEPEIRLAAVQALGRSGRGREDLDALGICLDSAQEPNPAVREKAWESYLALARRLPVKDQLEAAQRFDRSGDPASQRRRADLLLAIKNSTDRSEPLTEAQRLTMLDGLSAAQAALNEHASAAKTLGEALPLAAAAKSPLLQDLRVRLVTALLRDGKDDTAVARFREFAAASAPTDVDMRKSLCNAVCGVLETRLADADAAVEFNGIFDLASLVRPVIADYANGESERLETLVRSAQEDRLELVNRLLDSLSTDAEAATKLVPFGREVVLPEIASRLSRDEARRPAADEESRLIDAAKRLARDWPGYAAGAPEPERRAAIDVLRGLANASGSSSQ